jgi:hypothetical protein
MMFHAVSILSQTEKRPDGSRKFLAHFTVFPNGPIHLIMGDGPEKKTEIVSATRLQEWVAFAHWIGEKVIYATYPENRPTVTAHVEIKGIA